MSILLSKQRAEKDEVLAVPTPEPTETWHPISHGSLIHTVKDQVERQGLRVTEEEYGLARDGAQMFGVWALENGVAEIDYQLALGIRNSIDKSLSAGLAVGARVFVCDNLSFSGEITIARKHTPNILEDLPFLIFEALRKVGGMRRVQGDRISAYKQERLDDPRVHDFLIRSVDEGVMANSYIAHVLSEWREPRYEEFEDRTAWSLFNAYTQVFKNTNPMDLSGRTTRLHSLMDREVGLIEAPASFN